MTYAFCLTVVANPGVMSWRMICYYGIQEVAEVLRYRGCGSDGSAGPSAVTVRISLRPGKALGKLFVIF